MIHIIYMLSYAWPSWAPGEAKDDSLEDSSGASGRAADGGKEAKC